MQDNDNNRKQMNDKTTAILEERGKRYGRFEDHAEISQALKEVMWNTSGFSKLSPSQKEGLEMIQHKIARMLNGDSSYLDNVVDIIGYATLILRSMEDLNESEK